MYLRVINNVVHYTDNKGNNIIKQPNGDVLSEITKLINLNQATPETILPLIGDNSSIFVENEYFTRIGQAMYLKEVPEVSIPEGLLKAMYPKPSTSLRNFWMLSALNPNPEARDGLFWFLHNHDFEITEEGYFVAYRNVKTTETPGVYTDAHTGTTKIRMGEVVKLERSLCDCNPANTCSAGLHVAHKKWLKKSNFGNQGIMCLVNPIDVVAVPTDSSYGKLRCCQYFPIGHINYSSNGYISSETSVEGYKYTLDKIVTAQLANMLLATEIVDGKVKDVFKDMAGYRSLVSKANKAITKRMV